MHSLHCLCHCITVMAVLYYEINCTFLRVMHTMITSYWGWLSVEDMGSDAAIGEINEA